MALPIAIDRLLHDGVVESTRIEFKGGFNPSPIMRTICAFANDIDNIGGGYIVVGVEELDSRPVLPPRGLEPSQIDGILQQLHNLCHLIEPLYQPIVEPVQSDERWLIVIWVPGGHGRPYKVPKDVLAKDKSNKRYYIRKFSSIVIASPDEEKELFYISSTIPFDDQSNLAASVGDLSRPLLREVNSDLYQLSETLETADIAEAMQLVAGPPTTVIRVTWGSSCAATAIATEGSAAFFGNWDSWKTETRAIPKRLRHLRQTDPHSPPF